MKKIFLTGSTGFIGRNVKEFLQGRYLLFAPPREELDLLDKEAVRHYMEAHRVDTLIHAAITPGHRNAPDLEDTGRKNLDMFFNLLAQQDFFGRLILLGSGSEYDISRNLSRVGEKDLPPEAPTDQGGYAKYIQSQYAEGSDKILNLRPFGVFGKYEDYQIRFISNVICKSLFDLPLTIKQNRLFSYIYVGDLCRIIEHFIENTGRHKNYNAVPDGTVDLLSLANMVKTISGKELDIMVKTPGMGLEYTGSNARLRGELNGFVFTPLETAVRELYQWYSQNKDKIEYDRLLVDP